MYRQNNLEELYLVEVLCGLTNYTHAPHRRLATIDTTNATLMGELYADNVNGLSQGEMANYYAPLMSGISINPDEISRIRGGYNEHNKGVLKLKFRVNSAPNVEEYIIVFGYITNNDLQGELSENAFFTPVCSWREYVKLRHDLNNIGHHIAEHIIGLRTDYLLNDGSYSEANGLSTARPCDVLATFGDNAGYDDVMEQATREGIPDFKVINTTSAGAINSMGVICSNRKNYNPTLYTNTLLSTIIKCENGIRDDKETLNYNNGFDPTTSFYSHAAASGEIKVSGDSFLNYMKDINGTSTYRGFRGWQIRDIALMFPNFEQCIPQEGFRFLDASHFEVIDYTQISYVFGTTSVAETIAQELVLNILDLLIKYNLGQLEITGSNYKVYATEDRLSNIIIVPSSPASLSNGDIKMASNMIALCDDLKGQIFNKLNGRTINDITPLEFTVKTELMGITQVWLTRPATEEAPEQTYYFAFPTYAPNGYSNIYTDAMGVSEFTNSTINNVRTYFQN